MAFQPVIGVGGYSGWRILEATQARQRETFERSPMVLREAEYFRQNAAKAVTPEDLVKDRRLLSVALGAFGLGGEINKQAFIRKVLESDTSDPSSFASRLGDPRFKALAEKFGYGGFGGGVNVKLNSFREDVIARYKSLEFERAVGEVDNDMRLAMNFKREIAALAREDISDRTGWLRIMGNSPLRTVVATALGLPDSVIKLDVDQQADLFARKAEQIFGGKTVEVFSDPAKVELAIRRFFLFNQMKAGPSAATPGYGAMVVLQSSAVGAFGGANLFLSQG